MDPGAILQNKCALYNKARVFIILVAGISASNMSHLGNNELKKTLIGSNLDS